MSNTQYQQYGGNPYGGGPNAEAGYGNGGQVHIPNLKFKMRIQESNN